MWSILLHRLSTKKGETLIDTVNNILAMKVDMVVMRHPQPGAHRLLSRHIDAKIINAGDAAANTLPKPYWMPTAFVSALGEVGEKKVCLFGDIKHSVWQSPTFFVCKTGG